MFRRKTLLVLSVAAALSACVVAPYPQGGYAAGGAYGQPMAVAEVPPPAPYAEVIPVIPFPGAVWINGYWGWNAGRHVWIGGSWAQPRPGYYYNPHRWIAVQGRWHLYPGAWQRR